MWKRNAANRCVSNGLASQTSSFRLLSVDRRRDVLAFDERAAGYERGWRGRLHHEIAHRTAALAVATVPAPKRVLDVGCGTGYLLRVLARDYPDAELLAGVDPAPAMIKAATFLAVDQPCSFVAGRAEEIPYPSDSFDLVVSTTSFDHWADQRAGLVECARVLLPGGRLVLVDLFSIWLLPTLVRTRRARARTKGRANRLLVAAGFESIVWDDLQAVIVKAVTASV
jgi:ubiquinone/menaquinone biosynthesis C-methylase UbiE